MRTGRRVFWLAVTVGVFAAAAAAALAAGGVSWGTAIQVPGSGALNLGGAARVNSFSCSSPGVCAAVAEYDDKPQHTESFVASESNGTWGNAIEIPGLEALSGHGSENRVFVVSCAKAGWC